jgi:hypothetical protein
MMLLSMNQWSWIPIPEAGNPDTAAWRRHVARAAPDSAKNCPAIYKKI